MGLTLDIHHFVAGQFTGTRLQELLQAGLGVLVGVDQRQAVELGRQPGQHTLTRHFHASIQVDRTDQRFQGIGEDRLTAETAAFQLTGTQAQVFAQIETAGQYGQGFSLHQARAQTRQLAFAGLETLEQRFAGDEVEDGVTEEFQPFVVAPGKTAVSEARTISSWSLKV